MNAGSSSQDAGVCLANGDGVISRKPESVALFVVYIDLSVANGLMVDDCSTKSVGVLRFSLAFAMFENQDYPQAPDWIAEVALDGDNTLGHGFLLKELRIRNSV